MGMNRKWNMRVFEHHDPNGSQGGLPTPQPNDDVYIDTETSEIIMSKYPFTKEGMVPEGTSTDSILEIDLADLTKDPDFLEYITDVTNWHFREGNESKLGIIDEQDGDTIIQFNSIVKAFLDLPTESPKWVLKFDLHTNPSLYRSFLYFDGVSDETQTSVRYQYGMDIPGTGYPHLEEIDPETMAGETIENTIADEQYFTGAKDMPVVVTRWNNTYTLYYDNRYMITIPTDSDTLNRIGFWTWSGSDMYIKNPELYIIDDDSDATNIIINANIASNHEDGSEETGGNGSNSNVKRSYTIKKVWDDNDNAAGLRPDEVKLCIYYNGGILMGCLLKASENWEKNVILPPVNRVEECRPGIENYDITSTEITDNLVVVTNTIDPNAANSAGNNDSGNNDSGNNDSGNNDSEHEPLELDLYSFVRYEDSSDTEPTATGTLAINPNQTNYVEFAIVDSTNSEMIGQTYYMPNKVADGVTKKAVYPSYQNDNVLFFIAYKKIEYRFSKYDNESDSEASATGTFSMEHYNNDIHQITIKTSTDSTIINERYYILSPVGDGTTKNPCYDDFMQSTENPDFYITYEE